ncbi:MAG: DJ-1/PfpI family protein [Candidatus Thorarchaeota archaeon]
MKAKALLLVTLVLAVALIASPNFVPTAEAQEISDVKVLMLVTNAFGWNYFDAKEILETWGVNVTTVANTLSTDVPSCYNMPPRGTTADFLLNAVENDITTQFDAIFIPSGGHWASLIQSPTVLDFISYAHDNGVLIATTCIGNRVVAEANDIVNGSSVVYYDNINSYPEMLSAGAELRNGYAAVTDNRIITGNSGGGFTGEGYIYAPTSEICSAIVRETLGYSYVEDAEVFPLTGESGTSFNISVDVTDLDTELGDLSLTDINITEVQARIFTEENRTLVDTIELADPEGDWTYDGSFTGTVDGNYVIDIEVEDTNSTLVVEREAASFTIGAPTTGLTLDPLLIGGILACGLVVVAIVVIIKKR